MNEYFTTFNLPLVPYILQDRRFFNGALVTTPYGLGTVLDFEPIHAMYKVKLTQWQMANRESPSAYVHYKQLDFWSPADVGSLVSTPYGMGIVQKFRQKDGVHELLMEAVDRAYVFADCVTVLPAAVSEKVKTPYGVGVVRGYRREDEMYRIELKWGWLYAHRESNIQLVEPSRSCSVM